ncbi:TRAP transporter small permease subunit [Parasulfitobacter algicola]|uniref:C4-dicarboxylate ABC transporter permease n=1 Tax=Parasulfitobacter algicola TaxID=2614809 RepID=A0ABX2J0T8_9RHOB|nr:C4-dicarboxylate ABC transporter permease [Sulfitobacter algicola]NSX56408.1 C4-dicarboxylate ABC transporter permease [Sulfitobacter algicola]
MDDQIECSGFFAAQTEETISCLDKFQSSGALQWVSGNILEAFYSFGYAVTHPGSWLAWVGGLDTPEDKQSMMKFIFYGASVEFFFVVFTIFLLVTIAGLIWRNFMWRSVRFLEGFANMFGRFFAWAGLIMVLQQIIIVFMQRIFTRSEIALVYGVDFLTFDVSWWSEELKLYNALVVALCCTYTFVQGGHVRVDLVYSAVRFRTKRVIDMLGSLFFMMPVALVTWLYGWFYLWRNLVVPNVSAWNYDLDQLLTRSRAMRWNVETIGFSPNGFTAYFLFKILLVTFALMVFLQAIAFFYRSYLEWKEGPESEGKYLDKDKLGDADAELAANIH